MALVVWDGFDHYASATGDMLTRYGAWQYYSGPYVVISSPGRGGFGKCLGFQNLAAGQTYVQAGLAAPINQITTGFAINFGGTSPGVTINMVDVLAGGGSQCRWVFNPNAGTITFVNGAGQSIGTALNSISVNGWYFVEFQNKIGTTNGTAALRINGQSIPSFPDLTNINTQATSNNSVSSIQVYNSGLTGGPNVLFDDWYVADGTTGPGSYPANSFLGDLRTDTVFPVANASVQWTPLTGSNYQMVNNPTFDGDSAYNYAQTAGYQDSFTFQTLDADVNQVVGVQVTIAIRKEDAGARTVAPVLVIGGTTYRGTAVSVDVSYLYITYLWPINPATSASWTASDVNGLAAGYVVVT